MSNQVRNVEIGDKLDGLIDSFNDFQKQYDLDMRGDKSMNGGHKGVVGEIRDIKRTLRECPSLLWLMKHQTGKTFAVIMVVLMILSAIYIKESRDWILAFLGFPPLG